jgi:hypothetical protein
MILALQSAIESLLKSQLPDIFTGDTPATVTFSEIAWVFDPLSSDPVAGEPGSLDARDLLPFDPDAPQGPHSLSRSPYPGPRRVYLRSPAGERLTLPHGEILWDSGNPQNFTLMLRADRILDGFDQIEVLYSIVAAATQVKTLHQFTLQISALDANAAEGALALALAVLTLHRTTLMEQGGANWISAGYQAQSTVKELKLSAGAVSDALTRRLEFSVQVDLLLQRLLAEDEGRPIEQILSPGQAGSGKAIAIEPDVES